MNWFHAFQELIVKFPLKEVQSTRTQRPAAGSSYPYVEIMLGDLMSQRITQLHIDQVRSEDGTSNIAVLWKITTTGIKLLLWAWHESGDFTFVQTFGKILLQMGKCSCGCFSECWLILVLVPLQSLELCRVIAMHMENMLSVREKRLTLPPSEITLL